MVGAAVVFVLIYAAVSSCAPLPVPSQKQLEWSQMEIGAMISFGMETSAYNVSDIGFCGFQTGNYLPPANLFNPLYLDTDAWARAMVAFGANYAVLTAKHCSGFAIYPTKVTGYNYSVRDTTWMNGTDDVVLRYIKSCNKYGIKPGLYYAVGNNYYLNIHNGEVSNGTVVNGQRKITIQEYESIVLQQLAEIWTNYGELAEVWFDGGTYTFSDSIANLLEKYQLQSIAFQGPAGFQNLVRWVGNEDADPPYPSWSTASSANEWGGGSPPESGGVVWAPGESDTTIRNYDYWFWTDNYYNVGVKSLGELVQEYERSVGRNTNYLLNLSPDPYGVIPVADMYQYEQLGLAIKKCYSNSINQTSSMGKNVSQLVLNFAAATPVNRIVIQEDQVYGQLVRTYDVYYSPDVISYKFLVNGTSIGNKRIEVLASDVTAKSLLLNFNGISNSGVFPKISNFAAYLCARIN